MEIRITQSDICESFLIYIYIAADYRATTESIPHNTIGRNYDKHQYASLSNIYNYSYT